MRKRNWSQYNKELVQRGSLSFLIDVKALKKLSTSRQQTCMGRPKQFSDSVIHFLLLIKTHYRLTYRALERFCRFTLSKWIKIPNYTLPCKRAGRFKNDILQVGNHEGQVVLLDASGLRVRGEGEWKVKIHGRSGRRKWLKIHLALDGQSQKIIAEEITEATVSESSIAKRLLSGIKKPKVVIADGAYDRPSVREAIRMKKARALIPPPKNARYGQTDEERDVAIAQIKGLGGDKQAKSLWGKLTGYSRRALIETAFSRMKGFFGDKLYSRKTDNQIVECRLRSILMNRC
jgi:hypothetical protein